MSGEIKKIDLIKNMAVFHDFRWASSVRDGGNNIAEFKKINILYGRNYSGKTTLSRIFRALETGSISDKYSSPEFQLAFEGGSTASQNSLSNHGQVVRVFNEDFVRDNLRFIVDDEQTINSFAILGEDNTKLEEEIEKHEAELGSEEDKSGLLGKLLNADNALREAITNHKNADNKLKEKLRNKAREIEKDTTLSGGNRYQINHISKDIDSICSDSYTPISGKTVADLTKLLGETPKDEIKEPESIDIKYSAIAIKAKGLLERKIQASNQIQEWIDDVDLAKWVESGRQYHEKKRSNCAFCGHEHPDHHWKKLWDQLDQHFNQESKDLETQIDATLVSIDSEKKRASNLLKLNLSDFYSSFTEDLNKLSDQYKKLVQSYESSLESVKEQLNQRKADIFTPISFVEPTSVESELSALWESYKDLIKESNHITSELETKQSEARIKLRLHDIHVFINNLNYEGECSAINTLNEAMGKAEEAKNTVKEKVDVKRDKIAELKSQLKDESKGAERVNDYLNNFFGHQSLSLKAIEEIPGDASSGYRFEITRNNKKAFHLSEGECSLIAFCYFMAKLEDIETKGNQPIIWIDDPISSLDANHIFFVYSLINAAIVKPKSFLQLFISTHNLDFLKYLKRISGDYKGKGDKRTKIREFFVVERSGDTSQICLMPGYLKNYITEFNYLFRQIYECSIDQPINDSNYHSFYSFGNNARKFLEIYLYYKYPNGIDGDDKLLKFFGAENIPALFTDRVNNEYSHLCGGFERGASPIEVPEMKTVARQIVSKIKEKDPDQYSALLQSIGVTEEPAEEPQAAVEVQ